MPAKPLFRPIKPGRLQIVKSEALPPTAESDPSASKGPIFDPNTISVTRDAPDDLLQTVGDAGAFRGPVAIDSAEDYALLRGPAVGLNMKLHLKAAILGCSLVVLSPIYAGSQDASQGQPAGVTSDPVEISGDPSRQELFSLVKAASDSTDSGVHPGSGIPFNLFGPFTFPLDAVTDVVEGKPRADSIFGIDISHYTPSDIPLESLAEIRVRYVACKTSQGANGKDGKFEAFWHRLGALTGSRRIHRGAYHFLTAAGDAAQQAKTYVAVLEKAGGLAPTDLPPIMDLEWDIATANGPDRWAGTDPDAIIDKVLVWLKAVEAATGRSPMIYTARAWWRERIGSESKFQRLSGYKIWIADYSRSSRAVEVPKVPNGTTHTLWQFTDRARIGDWPGALDANIFKGPEAEFYSEMKMARFQ